MMHHELFGDTHTPTKYKHMTEIPNHDTMHYQRTNRKAGTEIQKNARRVRANMRGQNEEVRWKQAERARQCRASERPRRNRSSCREHKQTERMQNPCTKSTQRTPAQLMEKPWRAQADRWRTHGERVAITCRAQCHGEHMESTWRTHEEYLESTKGVQKENTECKWRAHGEQVENT